MKKKFGLPKVLGLLDGRVISFIDSTGVIRHVFNDLLNSAKHVTTALQILEEIQ